MILHHEDGLVCPLCEEKLSTAHTTLRSWFRDVKERYINVHVSWAWRGPLEQDKLYLEKKTNRQWPESAHNRMDEKNNPCSVALDLFQIDEDGVARFSEQFYRKLAAEIKDTKKPVLWGGTWKTKLGDKDHFELDLAQI